MAILEDLEVALEDVEPGRALVALRGRTARMRRDYLDQVERRRSPGGAGQERDVVSRRQAEYLGSGTSEAGVVRFGRAKGGQGVSPSGLGVLRG